MLARTSSLDIWVARNLGFIAAIVVIAGIMVWPQILWFYPFSPDSLFYMLGLFLLVCYWRYPHLPFHIPRLLFWIGSLGFIPCWALLRTALLRDFSNSPLAGLLIAAAFLAVAHIALSLVGLVAYLRNPLRVRT
jgi:hypothetical protein